MNHPSLYKDKEVVVLGLAKSGVAVAQLFHALGAKVVANDRKERHLCPEAEILETLGISVVCGGHPEHLIHEGVSLLIKNPGIPYTIPPIIQAEQLGIEIVTEVEVAYHVSELSFIGITGSNGKTTTTTWVSEILRAADRPHLVAGNIGTPLCEAVREVEPSIQEVLVELSSFQLKGISAFRPRVACLLNIYESHLDYHLTMEDYIRSKSKIFVNQTIDDVAVINWDDPSCRQLMKDIKSRILPFSTKERLESGVYLAKGADDADIVCRIDAEHGEQKVVSVSSLGIPGEHNVENALAAVAVSLALGVDIPSIAAALQHFRGVEHRLEFVRELNGVQFYNNSKATNAVATVKALESFQKPIVLIAGGQDRGVDFAELKPYLGERVKAMVTLGEASDKLHRVAQEAGMSACTWIQEKNDAVEALDQAVKAACEYAQEGDIVLLSPACASWDMFTSYEERGHIFKQSVHSL